MKKAFFRILIVCITILAAWSVYNRFNRSSLAPAEILGGVIRMENEGSDRLYYLTSQWETRETYSSSRVTSSKTTNSSLNVALPLATLSAWIPGEHHALIMGPAPSEKRSPMAAENDNPVLHILSVDLKIGAFQSFNPDLHRDWQMEESSENSQ
jgi:hypothetical protein